MNATIARALQRIGERLSHVSRRSAALTAVTALLATGGLGVLLAFSHPASPTGAASSPNATSRFHGREKREHEERREVRRVDRLPFGGRYPGNG